MSFTWTGKGSGGKVRCTDCGRTGWDTHGTGWQAVCLRGHAPCPRCGKVLSVRKDGSPRIHTRCPK